MAKRQTAVEWLVEQIFNDVDLKDSILKLAISQAKSLEKEQIIDAYENSEDISAELYYLATYGE
jgi:hypothetical protein